MARKNPDAPTHNSYSKTTFEEATIINVNKKTWTVSAETRHSSKTIEDIQCLVPYHHFNNGEGIHYMPEVGAKCLICWPSDNTPPIVMGYLASAASQQSPDETPERSTVDDGSDTDVSFRSGRPDLNPGDIAVTTRDENFLILRRGGVIQIGSTPVSQRLYLPIRNFIKDFCENYEMSTPGGNVSWTVERSENDPGGDAPASYAFVLHEHAQDAKASVRMRYLPLQAPGGGEKSAWEVTVAPQGIDPKTGEVSGKKYTMSVLMDGTKTEFIGANREVTIQGDDILAVSGKREVNVTSDETHNVDGKLVLLAGPKAVLDASGFVSIGNRSAVEPGMLGNAMLTWLQGLQLPVSGAVAGPPDPAQLTKFSNLVLSKKVKLA